MYFVLFQATYHKGKMMNRGHPGVKATIEKGMDTNQVKEWLEALRRFSLASQEPYTLSIKGCHIN
jgi:hypothetical protein